MGLYEAFAEGEQFDPTADYVIDAFILMGIGRLIWDFRRIRAWLARRRGRKPPGADP